MLNCTYCGKECKNENSFRNHIRLCKLNPTRQFTKFSCVEFQQTRKRSNQYIKAIENGTKYVLPVDAKLILSEKAKNRKHTDKTKLKMSKNAKERGFGGHTSKHKLYFEKNDGSVVYLQSSYEIEFAVILEKLNIEWSRPDPVNWIDDRGVSHRYYPDFKVGCIYLDTKNDYLAKLDARKIELVKMQNNIDLRIVLKSEITEDYIKNIASLV